MRTIPATARAKKGLIATAGAWLVLVDVDYAGSNIVRYVNNQENVTFGGNTYTAQPFLLSPANESIKGELPRTSISIYDPDLTLKTVLQDYDGLSGGTITIRRVYYETAAVPVDSEVVFVSTILDSRWDDAQSMVVFAVGISTPLTFRFPRSRYISSICRHKFRWGFCRYGEGVDANGFSKGILTTKLTSFHEADEPDLAYILCAPYLAYKIRIVESVAEEFNFFAGQKVEVSGSVHNNNIFEIDNVELANVSTYTRNTRYYTGDVVTGNPSYANYESGKIYRAMQTIRTTFRRINYFPLDTEQWKVWEEGTHLFLTSDYTLVTENEDNALTISLLSVCDHTLTLCRAYSNSHMYGGSPGIAEGIYG